MFDVSITGAAIAGLLSFLSPCILPIVPFYVSYLAGVSIGEVAAAGPVSSRVQRQAVTGAVFFAAGVITIFMGLGATASLFGQLVRDWFDLLRWAAAAVIFLMGLHFLGVVRIPILYRQLRADGVGSARWGLAGSFVIGMAFAFGWTPCVGPVLAAILFQASTEDSAGRGAALLFTYGLGMTLPFVLAAAFIGPFMRFSARFRPWLGVMEKTMGAFLVLFAVLIATESINYIAQWMLDVAPDIGILR